MERSEILCLMKNRADLRDKLFARGFIFTNDCVKSMEYPFYGLWKEEKIHNYTLMVSPKQKYYINFDNESAMILVGHAYNPFSMTPDENEILCSLNKVIDTPAFWNKLNELTGIFTLIWTNKDKLYVVGDPTCMQNTYYSNTDGHVYISSHTNLLGDLLSLEWDPYVRELSEYRFFRLFGNYLPGDLTQFREVRRVVPNHYYCFDNNGITAKRFYWPAELKISRAEIAQHAAKILHDNMELISKKWSKAAISMTGGCDSKTTLACANGLYDRFTYFSYVSSEEEKVDAEAAHKICSSLGLEHKLYSIPDNDAAVSDIENVRAILMWNTGNIRQSNNNDVRKRAFFADTPDFDVEVKSWASEVGRAYYSKRFNNRKNFGKKPTPRVCTTLYKVFMHNRKLVHKTDEVFERYLKKYFEQAKENPIPWQEQFFWEFRVSSWNGLVITGEHRYSFDITIPYNNRKLLELLLSASIDDRINDKIYSNIRDVMNPNINSIGISITNLKHTKKREKAENLYYMIHSHIPF